MSKILNFFYNIIMWYHRDTKTTLIVSTEKFREQFNKIGFTIYTYFLLIVNWIFRKYLKTVNRNEYMDALMFKGMTIICKYIKIYHNLFYLLKKI